MKLSTLFKKPTNDDFFKGKGAISLKVDILQPTLLDTDITIQSINIKPHSFFKKSEFEMTLIMPAITFNQIKLTGFIGKKGIIFDDHCQKVVGKELIECLAAQTEFDIKRTRYLYLKSINKDMPLIVIPENLKTLRNVIQTNLGLPQ